MQRDSIVIVGGGISGLSAAWELTGGEAGPNGSTPRVEIIEASDRIGGSLAATQFAGRTIDLGADGFLARRPEAVQLAKELGLSSELVPIDASGASIWLRGALHELPTGLVLGMPTSSKTVRSVKGLSFKAKLRARRDELFAKSLKVYEDISIGEIVRTKLGNEIAYQFVEPMIGGIQAGRIDQLSAKTVFPALFEAAKKGGSIMKALRSPAVVGEGPVFNSLQDGVGSLPEKLEQKLLQRGVVIRKGVAVTALRSTPSSPYAWEVDTERTTTTANAVILATPAPAVFELMHQLNEPFAPLAQIKSAGAAMVTFSVATSNIELPEHGTGVLVPLGTPWSEDDSLMVTAITFLDRKWTRLQRPEDVILRAHVGRIDDERWTKLSDNELTERVSRELNFLLKRFTSPLESLVQRWPQGLPQYYVGHSDVSATAKQNANEIKIALCGNAYDGVGIPASIGSGRRAGKEVLSWLAN